jgi:hypothetical protein
MMGGYPGMGYPGMPGQSALRGENVFNEKYEKTLQLYQAHQALMQQTQAGCDQILFTTMQIGESRTQSQRALVNKKADAALAA